MLNFISVELSKCSRFNKSDLGFLDTGHMKTIVDQTFAVGSNELAKADTFNQLYVFLQFVQCMLFCSVFGLTTKLRFSSMCQVLSKIGTIHFFWAADFYNYMDVMEKNTKQ